MVTIHDDFAAYYEMFPLGSGDRWYSAQLTSADGSDLGTRCDFGTAHLPDDLNRVNFVMCELIAKRAASFEDDLNAMRSPWSHEYVDKIRIFSATRRLAGQSGAVFAQFPWFDDNVAGVLVPFAQRLQRLRYDTWAEFQWDVAMEKAAVNRWGSTATPEPIVGVEVQLHSQTWWFTQDKVKRLIGNINEIRQESIDHPQGLMKRDGVLTVLGRVASATGPVLDRRSRAPARVTISSWHAEWVVRILSRTAQVSKFTSLYFAKVQCCTRPPHTRYAWNQSTC